MDFYYIYINFHYAVDEVRQGQEFNRFATEYSCQQNLLQILEIYNEELKAKALLNLVLSSEDRRNFNANLLYQEIGETVASKKFRILFRLYRKYIY